MICPLFFHDHGLPVLLRMASKGGQKVTDSPFAGQDALLEAKATGVVAIAWVPQVAQGLAARPMVADMPAHRNRVCTRGSHQLKRGMHQPLARFIYYFQTGVQ